MSSICLSFLLTLLSKNRFCFFFNYFRAFIFLTNLFNIHKTSLQFHRTGVLIMIIGLSMILIWLTKCRRLVFCALQLCYLALTSATLFSRCWSAKRNGRVCGGLKFSRRVLYKIRRRETLIIRSTGSQIVPISRNCVAVSVPRFIYL